jgi:fructosamine-3-kinase
MPCWHAIVAAVAAATGARLDPRSATRVGGGCINHAWRLRGKRTDVFVKTNTPGAGEMFAAEAEGLAELAAAAALRVPTVYAVGADAQGAWLALEWIVTGDADARSERTLGEGLAQVHRREAANFGWHRDNTIGSTLQRNDRRSDWPGFFADLRLGFQLDLAARNGWSAALIDDGRRLQERLTDFFPGYRPVASLLHGDLWGGNWAACTDGRPFVFDPAVYYGDREADLAMTQLFGGFGPAFYAAYQATWPTDPGYEMRRDLYNLYHVLNHLNLFGASYLARARHMIRGLSAALR